MMLARIPLLVAVLFALTGLSAQTTRILFLGNSYTGSNNLPVLVKNLALSLGDTIFVDSNTPGGYTIEGHTTNVNSLNKINSQQWDYVVIQEQSQLPSFPPAQVASQVLPFATQLIDSIRDNHSCTESVFFMTWGRENGDQGNCASWPPVCTYDGMQGRLRESYLQMSYDNNAWCAPVGVAWKNVRDNHPLIDLYTPDGSHPNINGSYLAACTFYATMFGKSPMGATFISTVNPADASILQQVASNTVLDSSAVWNIGVNDPVAAYSAVDGINGSVQFESFSTGSGNTLDHTWDFGDGMFGTGVTNTHQYQTGGSYATNLIVTDDCGRTDTLSQTIQVIVNGMDEHLNGKVQITAISPNPGEVSIILLSDMNDIELRLFDVSGGLSRTYSGSLAVGQTTVFSSVTDGMYYLQALTDNGLLYQSKFYVH